MSITLPSTIRSAGAASLLSVLLIAGACSSDDAAAGDDVATLGGAPEDDADGGEGTAGGGRGGRAPDEEFQDAMVEFAECMREHGIDMPDPQATGGGGIVVSGPPIAAGSAPSDAQLDEMEEANAACAPILEDAAKELPPPDPEQLAEMQEQALAFAECMREHGIDMPDPVFDEGGRTQVAIGEPGEAPPFDDEEFQEAADACGEEGGFGFQVGSSSASAGSDG